MYEFQCPLLSRKRERIWSVVVTWMTREPVTQVEVSQKETNKYRVLTHAYGIWKNSAADPICRGGKDWRHRHREWFGGHSRGRRKKEVKSLSRVRLCDPMDCSLPCSSSMGFSRQEYRGGLPFPPPGDLPNPGIEPRSPTLQAELYRLSHQESRAS